MSDDYDDIRKAFEKRWTDSDSTSVEEEKMDRAEEIDEELDRAAKIDLRNLSEEERRDLAKYIDQLEREKSGLEGKDTDAAGEEEYERQSGGPSMAADSPSAVLYRVQTEADIPRSQKKQLNSVRQLFGLHVPLSNTLRRDNLRHINTYNLAQDYIRIPKLRHLGVERMGATTTELQLARSNEEVGGFERKAQISMIKREAMNVQENRPLRKPSLSERFLGVKKEPEPRARPPEG